MKSVLFLRTGDLYPKFLDGRFSLFRFMRVR